MSFLQIDDTKIYYESKGSGVPLIFVHAGISDSRMWDDQFNYFSNKYRVVRFDLRGTGKSKSSQVEFSHAVDLNKILKELRIDKAHFIACSLGVSILFDFVLQFPEKILSLTLVNGTPYGVFDPTKDPPALANEAEAYYNDKNIPKLAEIETLIWLVGRKRNKNDIDELLFQKVVDMDSTDLENEIFHPSKEKILHPDVMEKLEPMKVPSAYIIGTLDEPGMKSACEQVAKKLQSDIYYIENTAHLPNMERPLKFNELVEFCLSKTNEIK